MKRANYILMTFLLLFCHLYVYSQVITSKESSIYINNKTKTEEEVGEKKSQPSITIISPDLKDSATYYTSEQQLNIIGKVVDEKGINSVFINGKKIEISQDGIFWGSLDLKAGMNKIRIVAVNTKGNYSGSQYTIDYNSEITIYDSKIDLNVEGKYYALIIGVNQYYDSDIISLDNPIPDAGRLYEILNSNYKFEKENMKLMTNPERADIINALDEFAGKITPVDNLLIFYAGHGWWDEVANIGYWLPSDAKKSSKAAWFRNSTLCDYLKEINSQHTLLITDACFGGSIFKTRSVFDNASKAIQKLYELPSRKAMTSGTLTEVPDRSAFIRYLIERLSSNEGKYLSSEQLFSSFRLAVINNSDVVPQYGEIRNVGDEGGDFIFIKR
ncbi:MAG: caspase family protein [Bacteroidales bacterium]|nr:caspase family protein [Bacteroidales bacterium]